MSFFATAEDRKTIFFSSHDVSKPDSGSYLSEVSVKYLTFVVFGQCPNEFSGIVRLASKLQ